MIEQYLGISTDKLVKAGWETLYMVGFSLIIGSVVGFLIAIILWLTRKGGLKENRILYTILNGFINVVRSTPFIILLVCVMPVTKFIVGTRIGTKAAIVPLVIYTAPFLARLLENSLLDVNAGIIEAAQAMGAPDRHSFRTAGGICFHHPGADHRNHRTDRSHRHGRLHRRRRYRKHRFDLWIPDL